MCNRLAKALLAAQGNRLERTLNPVSFLPLGKIGDILPTPSIAVDRGGMPGIRVDGNNDGVQLRARLRVVQADGQASEETADGKTFLGANHGIIGPRHANVGLISGP